MRIFKKILPYLLFVFIFIAVNEAIFYALVPYQYTRMKLHHLESEDYDDLILGTSHGASAFDPEVISSVTGRSIYNAAAGGCYPRDQYYMLKDACRKHVPERVIIEFDPTYWSAVEGMNNTQIDLVRQMEFSPVKLMYFVSSCFKSDFRCTLLPWYMNISGVKQVPDNLRIKRSDSYVNCTAEAFHDELQEVRDNGFIAISAGAEGNRTLQVHDFVEKEFDENRSWFLKTVRLCREKGIQVIVVETPVPETTVEGDRDFFTRSGEMMAGMAESEGFMFLDFALTDPDGGNAMPASSAEAAGDAADAAAAAFSKMRRAPEDFMDAEGHMYEETAQVFSGALSEILGAQA